ncbi:hypothetical protein LF63_0107575 [Oleiagrimonas soli]|uniref:DUF2884 domain-containing protein n=1 Tax=Oleiagrimonas soli TaxID=1543381 RepID=A0A099CW50_9GAMM|nr:hypothetical protein LF63_0107575 [Oleiagrimonas soli]
MIAGVLAATFSMTACGRNPHTYINISHGNIVLQDDAVTIHADDAPTATVTSAGDLRIGTKTIAVDAAQRQLLRTYYQDAERIGHQAVDVGKAGANMAGGTIRDVFSNLADGHPDRIDADVKKRTATLLEHASRICDTLQSMQGTQDAIAAQLDAFRPYTRLQASDAQECRADIAKERSKLAQSDD